MDQDSTFMSSLMTYLLNKFNITIKTVTPYNHQSFQAEYGIKYLSTILTNHLTTYVRCSQNIYPWLLLLIIHLIPQI